MDFEWQPEKAGQNLRKHKVSFQEAATVFADPLAYTFPDPEHSRGEARWLTYGWSDRRRLLAVCHLEHNERVRIVSAREATKRERQIYEEG
jgi:uncharacterized DUF497 family protein